MIIKRMFVFFLAMIICLSITGCSSEKTNQSTSLVETETEDEVKRTWQEMCLNEDVSRNVSYLYINGGTTSDLKNYYENLLGDFNDSPTNLFVKKFKTEYEKLNYDSLNQLERDILNGLIFYWFESFKDTYFSFDIPIEKAWMVGEGENNTNPQKHRKIVLKLNVEYLDDVGIEMDFWINKNNKEEHSANYYSFGEDNNPNYDARTGINDTTLDSGVWESAFKDYYNNEKYVSLNVNIINEFIQKNRSFLEFMKEYVDIYKRDEYEKERAIEVEKERKKTIQPEIGMTKEDVLEGAWGSPDRKNITENASGVHEQWVYKHGKYIYFDNGIVTSIQKSE